MIIFAILHDALHKTSLIKIVGVLNAPKEILNKMTNEVTQITNLLAQGVRTPKDLLLALFSAAASIVGGIADIKNAADEYGTITNPFTGENTSRAVQQFLSNADFTLGASAITEKEQNTKRQTENAFRITSLYAAALILPELVTVTYNKVSSLLQLYTKLENSINQNDPQLYRAIADVRIALSESIAEKNLAGELQTALTFPIPILSVAHYLGCEEKRLRELNDIADSFVVKGAVRYV